MQIKKSQIVIIALAIITIVQIVLGYIYPHIGLDYNTTDLININYNSSPFSKVLLIIALSITPAIFEELFFRKGVIDLCEEHGKPFAILFSALLFGFIHMNISQMIFAFAIGIVFATIYTYTKDIKLTMFIHFLNNGFACIAMLLPAEGQTAEITSLITIITIGAVLILGIIKIISLLKNPSTREKILQFAFKRLNLDSFKYKYKYIFFNYIFDISIILIFIMSLLTEKIYRMIK